MKLKKGLIVIPCLLLLFGCSKKTIKTTQNITTNNNTEKTTTKVTKTTKTVTTTKEKVKYYKANFYNNDNSLICSIDVKEGEKPVYNDTPKPVIELGYEATFTGWDKEFNEMHNDVDFIAQYSEKTLKQEMNSFRFESTTTECVVTGLNDYEITDIVIPNCITKINNYPFSNTYNLNNVYYDGTIEDWCGIDFDSWVSNPMAKASNFYLLDSNGTTEYNGKKYSLYTETDFVVPSSITKINDYAFFGFEQFETITILDTVTQIGSSSFGGCKNIKKITIPFVGKNVYSETDIDKKPFGYIFGKELYSDATKTKQYVDNGMISVEYYIPNSLKEVVVTGSSYIQYAAFLNCNNIEKITIPNTVNKMSERIFSGCSSLKTLVIPFVGEKIYTATDSYQYPLGFNFGNIKYTGGVETEQTYYGASATDEGKTTVKYIIPSSLKTIIITKTNYIQFGAFDSCTNIENIVLPSTLTGISTAFSGCSGLVNTFYNGTMDDWCNINFNGDSSNPMKYSSDFYLLDENGEIELNEKKYKLTIEIDLSNILTRIDSYAFEGFNNLTSVYFDGTIEEWYSIDFPYFLSNPFYYAKNLYLSDNDGDVIFDGKKYSLATKIELPNTLKETGQNSFWSIESITDLYYKGTIEDWCNMIINGVNANPLNGISNFYILDNNGSVELNGNKYSLVTELVIPGTIENINKYQFSNCKCVEKIIISSGIKNIYYQAFYNCSFNTIIIEESVTWIEGAAFQGTGYFDIVIPKTIFKIKDNAFAGCQIKSVFYKGSSSEWSNIDFSGGNDPLKNANRYYYSESEPVVFGDYWHYDASGNIAIWEYNNSNE